MYRSLLFLAGCALSAQTKADLVLQNGKVVTLDPRSPQVQAIAVRGGRILTLGSNGAMKALTSPATKLIDLGGRLAVPGLIEGHGHLLGVGEAKMSLNLRNVHNWDEIVALVAQASKTVKPGTWIIGGGFHQSKWDKTPQPNVQGFPLHAELSKVSPNNPVWLTHASGHAAMVNAAALKQAEITSKTADPVGGQILKDDGGQPTGALLERAQGLLEPAYEAFLSKRSPEEVEADARRKIDLAAKEAVSNGITTFEDAGSSAATVDLLRQVAEEGKLDIRVWMMLGSPPRDPKRYRILNAGAAHLTVRAIKQYMDGALGSRGAWMLEPYADLPSSSGLNTEPLQEIRKAAEVAITNGYQLCVHAIGDRANREVLDLYEAVFREHPEKKDLRWRIEHAQHLNPADIPRFGKLGVIAAMQPIHCTSDAPFVIPRLGPKRAEEGAYVWRSLLDSGAVVGSGTDAPVEEVDPMANFYAAVTRKLKDGTTFFPAQRMTREEALKAYTLNNAYAAFEDQDKGSLVAGKLADITVLSKDILTVPEDEIPGTRVIYTIVGGKVVFASH